MRNYFNRYLVLCSLLTCIWLKPASAQSQTAIIPQPREIEVRQGEFMITSTTQLKYEEELSPIADYLNTKLENLGGFGLQQSEEQKNVIAFRLSEDFGDEEAYRLSIDTDGVEIAAGHIKGLFYGVQSLLQLLPPVRNNASLALPYLEIEDAPLLSWRGLMLDVSRHFYTTNQIKDLLDLMAAYKLNVFHWHLVDTEAWRLEVKQYPKLTEIGAWRMEYPNSLFYNNDESWKPEGEPYRYGGFYSQEEVKDIVAYAKERQITVMPEIELPGHSGAVMAAYPHLSCNENPQATPNSSVHSGVGFKKEWNINYCAGKEGSFTFLENVLTEVMELFPSEYIHIGGDEVDMEDWKACPHCQQRMKDQDLESEEELQGYFIRRIERFLTENGRKMIGWDEILEGGISSDATVMSWRGEKGGIEAAKMGNDVIMSPSNPLYLNRVQGDPRTEPHGPSFSINTLERVYDYHPVPEALGGTDRKHIVGTQIAVWTEFISSVDHLEYMLLPRLPAFAELSWTGKEKKNFPDFVRRLNAWHFPQWKQTGRRFHPAHIEGSPF